MSSLSSYDQPQFQLALNRCLLCRHSCMILGKSQNRVYLLSDCQGTNQLRECSTPKSDYPTCGTLQISQTSVYTAALLLDWSWNPTKTTFLQLRAKDAKELALWQFEVV